MEENFYDSSLFSEKSLYLLNIRELRGLARKFGVPSPTTKSKQELVNYILDIVYGKVEKKPKTIFGRKPSTNAFDMGKFLGKVKDNSDDEFYEYLPPPELNLKVSSPLAEYDSNDNLQTRIYCNIDGKHYLRTMAFVKSDGDIELDDEFVQHFNLSNSDIVEFLSCDDLIKIVSINGIKKNDVFSDLSICSKKLHAGFSDNFLANNESEVNSEIAKIISFCEKNETNLLIFTKNDYQNKKIQSIKYFENEDKTEIYKKLMLFTNMCEKAVRTGCDVIVIIEDKIWIKNILMEFETDVSARIEKYLSESFEKITKLGNIYITFSVEDDVIY